MLNKWLRTEDELIWNTTEGAYTGNLCQKILQGALEKIPPAHSIFASHESLSVSMAAAVGRAGCELFSAENSSNRSQSLDNRSQVLRMVSKAALGQAFSRAQVWVAPYAL